MNKMIVFDALQMEDLINELYPSPMYQALGSQSLLGQLDKDRFQQIQKNLSIVDVEDGMDLLRFIQILMQVIPAEPEEIIYMTIGLMEMFREVSEYAQTPTIKMKDLSAYVCESFANEQKAGKVNTFKVPDQKTFDADKFRVREIDLYPPLMLGTNDDNMKHLLTKIQTDCVKHNSLSMRQAAFSPDMNKIITLDQLATSLSVYNLDCALEYRVQPKSENETVILDFAWSHKHQRIGMTLKDHSLCFCDNSDNFKFQKRFSLTSHTVDYQSQIWFLEFNNLWVSTDKSFALNVWDIEREELQTRYLDKLSQAIVEVQEIVHLKLVAVAQRDKKILLWELEKNQIKLVINLQSGGIHTMLYSYGYQVLLTSGYDNRINIYSVHITLCDYEIKGRLVGHASMVTALQILANTPLVVSTDDFGSVRLWDIRSLKCVQQLSFGNKSQITKILDISSNSIIAFIGTRLNVLILQSNQQKCELQDEQLWVIRAEYDAARNQFIICTRRDVRIIDAITGRVLKILNGLLENVDDEIVCFRSLNQFSQFIIGDLRGKLTVYKYHNCEELFKLQSHGGDVSFLTVDVKHNILITAGSDAKIFVQQLTKPYQMLRELTNIFEGKAITALELSVHHNILVCCSGPEIVVYDYELGKMLSIIQLEDQEEPTQLIIVNGFGLLCIATNLGLVYILKFLVQDQKVVHYEVLGLININSSVPMKQNSASGDDLFTLTQDKHHIKVGFEVEQLKKLFALPAQTEYAIKLVLDLKMNQNKEDINKCYLMIGTNKGRLMSYDLKKFIEHLGLQTYPHASKRMNYNAFRQNKENFKFGRMKMPKEFNIRKYALLKHTSILDLNSQRVLCIQAHKDSISEMNIIEKNQWFIITTALDGYLRLWANDGKLHASLNINHPLAIQWDIKPDNLQKFKKQFFYAIKIIQIMDSRSKLKNHPMSSKFNDYLKSLMQTINDRKQVVNVPVIIDKIRRITKKKDTKNIPPQLKLDTPPPRHNTVILMKDEYSPRDIRQSSSVVQQFSQDYTNLKTLAVIKKKLDMQNEWKKELVKFVFDVQLTIEKNDEAMIHKEHLRQRQQDKETFFPFLEEDYHSNFLNPHEDKQNMSPFKKQFNIKLDSHVLQQQSQRILDTQKQSLKMIKHKNSVLSDEISKISKFTFEEEEKQQNQILKTNYHTSTKKKVQQSHVTSKSKNSQDFFDYATKNIICQDSMQDLIFDSSRSQIISQIQLQSALPKLYKQKKERMKNILNALDSNLKQSQSNSSLKYNHSTERSRQLTLNQSKVIQLPSIREPYQNSTRDEESLQKMGLMYVSQKLLSKKTQDISFLLDTDQTKQTDQTKLTF